MGKTVKMPFEMKPSWKMVSGQKIHVHDSEKTWIAGGLSASTAGQYTAVHVYYQNI